MLLDRITVDPVRVGGLPTIRETRFTVGMILGRLAAGRSIDELLADYPYLERDDVLAALKFADSAVCGREVAAPPAREESPGRRRPPRPRG